MTRSQCQFGSEFVGGLRDKKLGLAELLRGLAPVCDPHLVSAIEDDVAVYKLTEDLAIVVSVDYFTPIVRDAYTFGQIAAANALSDVYAMGAKPIVALNIVCFPAAYMDLLTLKEAWRGSLDKFREANVLSVFTKSLTIDSFMGIGLRYAHRE